jgi:hypothetical protein
VIENGAKRRGRIVHLADVVDTDIPFIARSLKHVRETARRVVTFEDQNPLPGVAREQRCRR